MKICFPVQRDEGMASMVFGHFGSAAAFLIIDREAKAVTTILNADRHHAPGACNPLKAIDGQRIDVVVVGGIGAGALARLSREGVRVLRARTGTVEENLALLDAGMLEAFDATGRCGGHGKGNGGCSHH